MRALRVLQLATSTGGGAGIAARRTHEALLENDVDSTLMTLTSHPNSKNAFEIQRSKIIKILSSSITLIQAKVFQSSDQLITPVSLDSFRKSRVLIEKYDVIHIHAFYNMLSTSAIAKMCRKFPKKKFFVTLHDERLLTGGCHYSNGCQNIHLQCNSCPQATYVGKFFVSKDFKRKSREFSNLNNLEIITPSNWLKIQAEQSPFLEGFRVHLVRNPVPEIFFNIHRTAIQNGIPRIVFISAQLNTRMKGLKVLIQALNSLAENGHSHKFKLMLIGTGELPQVLDARINFDVAITKTDSETAKELEDGQILVVPSLQDNLPSTMVEALCSGLAIIGSRTGGITEILETYKQELFDVGDYRGLSNRLLALIEHQLPSDTENAKEEFSYKSIANQLMKIYEGELEP